MYLFFFLKKWNLISIHFPTLHYITCHLADAFFQSDLQLLHMSEDARLWSNYGPSVLLRDTLVDVLQWELNPDLPHQRHVSYPLHPHHPTYKDWSYNALIELWSCNILCHFCACSLNIVFGFHCFPSPSFCPLYPCLVFPPTLPIILDVMTHYNVTHKGKWLLCLVTDLPWTNSSLCIRVKKSVLKVSLSCH